MAKRLMADHESRECDEELQVRFNLLLEEGVQREATSKEIDTNILPDYFNQERFDKAQEICQKYYTNISVASTAGLLLLLQLESIAIPLLKTGKSRTVMDLYDRYSATAKYIKSCYESNFYDKTSEGWKHISLVRSMHLRGAKMMSENPDFKLEPPKIWFNQYDMALTQFAFIGLFLLHPKKCCAYHIKDDELAEVTYFWRVLSYYFGVEEQYNIFVYHDNFSKQREYMSIIVNHQMDLLRQKPRMPAGLKMAEGVMLAFEDLAEETSFNIMDHWWSPEVSLSGREELAPYSWSDLWRLIFFNFYFRVLFRSELLMSYMNEFYKKKFEKFLASGDKIKKKLERKYKDFVCEL